MCSSLSHMILYILNPKKAWTSLVCAWQRTLREIANIYYIYILLDPKSTTYCLPSPERKTGGSTSLFLQVFFGLIYIILYLCYKTPLSELIELYLYIFLLTQFFICFFLLGVKLLFKSFQLFNNSHMYTIIQLKHYIVDMGIW